MIVARNRPLTLHKYSQLDHAAEHALAPRQHQTDHHDGQQEEYKTEKGGDDSTAVPKLLVLLHLVLQLFGAWQVQCKVRLGSGRGLWSGVKCRGE